jgi:hypothetical protein
VERHFSRLVLAVERAGVVERDRRRKKVVACPQRGIDHGNRNAAKIEMRAVAYHLRVERRIAVAEGDREAELRRIETTRGIDVADVDLRLRGKKAGSSSSDSLRHRSTCFAAADGSCAASGLCWE